MAAMMVMFPFIATFIHAQGSPDSRICNCFAEPVPDNFMRSAKAFYGSVGLALSPNIVLPPQQMQPVKFVLPVIHSKQSCSSWYSIYITDEGNRKVYEAAGANNEITYTFPDCGKTYTVMLMAYSKSIKGGDGNCSRRLNITVKPKCNTATCGCEGTGKSAPYSLSGEVQCKERAGDEFKYLLRFDIVNKSDCILDIQAITIFNRVIEVPPYSLAPKSNLNGVTLGFSAPSGLPITETKAKVLIKYSLNGRRCSDTSELPYKHCFNTNFNLPNRNGF